MGATMRISKGSGEPIIIIIVAVTLIIGMSLAALPSADQLRLAFYRTIGRNSARLVSIEELPEISGDYCERPAVAGPTLRPESDNLFADFRETAVHAQDAAEPTTVTRPPLRKIQDDYPIYSSVGVDPRLNEVFLQDANMWSIRVFNRDDNTPSGVLVASPKRVIGGSKTDVQFNSCVYVDPVNGDVYSAENDIGDSIVMFSHEDQINGARNADGDIPPTRKLKVTHRAFNLAVDDQRQELFVTIQYPPQVAVYRKQASENEQPLRVVKGEKTRLSDVHGIIVDTKNKLLIVNSWGNISDYRTAGTGRFESASIDIYPIDAKGDTPPIAVIQGSKTELDWPGAMSLDPDNGDLYVANDVGQSILVFHETDKGNVAPSRIIKGNSTGISYPTGVFVDTKNKELWVSNLGNSSATVYPLSANGDLAPLRTIRSRPEGTDSLRFGKTQALAYDSTRQQILVPN